MNLRADRSFRRWSCGAATAWAGVAVVLAVMLIGWPGIHGFWGRDDFAQLAFVRLLGSPWALFTHDHYIVPGTVFRPLGFASMWLGERLFGQDYAAHVLSDLALHALVALALLSLMRRACVPLLPAVACVLLFALHPAVMGTALWWSARFDLLATLFIVLALHALWGAGDRLGPAGLVGALVAMLAAMLSKEIGLVAAAAFVLVAGLRVWREPGRRPVALATAGVAVLGVLVFLLWRAWVLGTPGSGLTGSLPMTTAIGRGLIAWWQQAPGYLSFWSRLAALQQMALIGATGVLLVGIVVARRCWHRPQFELWLTGLCLLLLPALLQAPVMALNAAPLRAGMSAIDAAMQSRLYYLGMAGVALMIAAGLSALWQSKGRILSVVAVLAVSVMVAAFAVESRVAADQFAQRSMAIAAQARELVAAVQDLPLPAGPCHVTVTGLESPPEWGGFVFADSIVKALAPDLRRVGHCWFHSDQSNSFYLLAAPATLADARPYRVLEVDGQVVPWRRIGDVVIAFLAPRSGVEPDPAQRRLQYRAGRFVQLDPEPAKALDR